ncbi:MAG: Gfo/Idh/MocA family oxidoreductase [Clostridiales bacterium]|nr:Gfo/Idh/MocA family oxidoreductase [Clostridiales bacterium]
MDRKIRFGVFGCTRGQSHMKNGILAGGELVAICDKQEKILKSAQSKDFFPKDAAIYTDFDKFIEHDMDCVVLCNYFHEHAEYAITAMRKGKHVLSETTAGSSFYYCTELCQAVEETGMKYMLGENYPYTRPNMEIKRVYDSGTLGRVLYGEGEYVHPSPGKPGPLMPELNHWRRWLPRTYYATHALGPLLYMTGLHPKEVTGFVIPAPDFRQAKYTTDIAGIIITKTETGAIFRTTGCAGFAPHGSWYRLGCMNGGIERVRGEANTVRLAYNEWQRPEGMEENEKIYQPEWISNAELAEKAGHGGGDFWNMYDFFEYISGGAEPHFTIYNAVDMSLVEICAWRSVLRGNVPIEIPDFRDEAVRRRYEHDKLTPFWHDDKEPTLPCCSDPTARPLPEYDVPWVDPSEAEEKKAEKEVMDFKM